MSASLQIEKIDQIAVCVHDIEKAVAFYRDKLELKLAFNTNNMAFFSCGGITIMLGVPEKAEFDHRSSVIYFEVKNMEESYRLLSDRNVTFRGKPHIVHKTSAMEHWMVFFEDEDDNVLALTSKVAVQS